MVNCYYLFLLFLLLIKFINIIIIVVIIIILYHIYFDNNIIITATWRHNWINSFHFFECS